MTTAGSPAEEIMDLVDAYAHVYHSDEESYPLRPDAKRPPKVTGTLAHVKQVMTETRVTKSPTSVIPANAGIHPRQGAPL